MHVFNYMQGIGLKFYLELASGSTADLAIVTFLNEDPSTADKYYLQPYPGDDNNFIVQIGTPYHTFGFVAAQPLPDITAKTK